MFKGLILQPWILAKYKKEYMSPSHPKLPKKKSTVENNWIIKDLLVANGEKWCLQHVFGKKSCP